MKILHTSDLHLGHVLYREERTEEQLSMLEQMVAIVRDERPDVFVLSGDVYDTAQPSAAVQTMLARQIVALHNANPSMRIVMTAGNHDSGSKHEIFRVPWEALGVYAIGQLNKNRPEDHIIEIAGVGFVLAVPYVHERNMPEGFYQMLLDKTASRNAAGLPVVLMAHTTVRGSDIAGHERATELTVGGIEYMDIEAFGTGYDYLALGHIHKPQFIHTGSHNVRYSGSPLAVSFDESYEHTVTMVEIAAHGAQPTYREIPIINPRPLVTLPTQGSASWDETIALLRDFPSDIPAYIRLNVAVEDFLPATAEEDALRLTEGKQCRLCRINATRKGAGQNTGAGMSVQEFQAEAPIEIAKRYAEDTGVPFDEEMIAMFNDVIQTVHARERE